MLAPSAICVTGGQVNTETMLKVEEEGMFLTVTYALCKQGFAPQVNSRNMLWYLKAILRMPGYVN